mmetsp:Transcript_8241/g.17182  ORF Transcript_8241/g.17182 Transcript_8241/m.17182 type:complete len:143 (+) Transcript_8241:75-503(+)
MIQAGLIVRRARVINIGSIRRNYSTTSLLRLSESISSSRRIKWVKLFSTFSSSNCTLGVKIILPRILTRKCDEKGNITTKKIAIAISGSHLPRVKRIVFCTASRDFSKYIFLDRKRRKCIKFREFRCNPSYKQKSSKTIGAH